MLGCPEMESEIRRHSGGGQGKNERTAIPLSSEMTRMRASGDRGEVLNYHQTDYIQTLMDKYGISASAIDVSKMIREAKNGSPHIVNEHGDQTSVLTVRQEEKGLRREISRILAKVEKIKKLDFGTMNRLAIRKFKESREVMKLPSLRKVLRWAQDQLQESSMER
jgi:hypothetical protein